MATLKPDSDSPPPLCALCAEFTTDLLAYKIAPQEKYAPRSRWVKRAETSDAYQHHDTLQDLRASAATCALCRLFASGFASADAPDGSRTLELCPFWPIYEHGYATYITATFNDLDGEEGTNSPWKPDRDPHRFRIVRRRAYDADLGVAAPNGAHLEGDFKRALPSRLDSEDAFNTARVLLARCVNDHPACKRNPTPLPKRIIDVGQSPDDPPRLYISQGEKTPYLALSHCWGGDIPCRTLQSNLEAYQTCLPATSLPQNFRDAFRVTRELGLRYVWIDALCIVQDSHEDWKEEAAKMASIYAGAHLTISAIEASKSTEGFLGPRRLGQVILDSNFAIRADAPADVETLTQSVLNTRGWCVQERLLAGALLHYGRDQMLWECATEMADEEDGEGQPSFSSDGYVTQEKGLISYAAAHFISTRRTFAAAPPERLAVWYGIVEEFSRRDLTFGGDKFPAIAGVARRFSDAGLGGAYMAGLGREHGLLGLLWCARTRRLPRVKAPGFHGRYALTRPAERRAPSWSWASVDGPVEFRSKNLEPSNVADPMVFEVLDVDIGAAWDDMTAEKVEGTLKVRALLAKGQYYIPEYGWEGVGGYRITDNQGKETLLGNCIMDFEPGRERECWALAPGKGSYMLMLEEVGEGRFARIGYIEDSGFTYDQELPRAFKAMEILLE
ncbi:hypothetical protein DL765_008968 [Monosporascus sp. GIB2]|nr:hypothetical protein DL765_008968 [Monosporascus sp. GIB2]